MRTVLTLAALASFAAGCAHSGPRMSRDGQPLLSVRDVDARPELVGCAHEMPPADGHGVRVETSFTVTDRGTVEGVMIGRIGSNIRRQQAPADVREMVASCMYLPAMKDGVAVGVWDMKRYTYVPLDRLGMYEIDGMDMERARRKSLEAGGESEGGAQRPVKPSRGNGNETGN